DNGDDRLSGDLGSDIEHAGNGNDIVEGGNGGEILFGDNGNDFLFGNQDGDHIHGGNGDDLIRVGQGTHSLSGHNRNGLSFRDLALDIMYGGNGNDTFAFDAAATGTSTNPSPVGATGDFIIDFDLAGDDRLDLGAAGNALNFVNTGQTATTEAGAAAIAASHMNGTVIYVTVNLGPGDETLVFWDTNADGTPDEEVHLVG